MAYRELGSSGLRVSVLTRGTPTFGGCEAFADAYPRRIEPVSHG
jgi:aryl-alcohol dehydrogenase-like predicted oxidoreductase